MMSCSYELLMLKIMKNLSSLPGIRTSVGCRFGKLHINPLKYSTTYPLCVVVATLHKDTLTFFFCQVWYRLCLSVIVLK